MPPLSQQRRLSPEEQFTRLFLEQFLPEQADIPSFDESGLFNEDDATRLFERIYSPYFAREEGAELNTRSLAEAALNRALTRAQEDHAAGTGNLERLLGNSLDTLSDSAAASGQLGSGVHQREAGEMRDEVGRQRSLLDRELDRLRSDRREEFRQEYDDPYGRHQRALDNLKNQRAITRSGFLEDERSRARDRYADRFTYR
jgi:hypothetical protein